MTQSSRILIVFSLFGILLMPFGVSAKIGIHPGFERRLPAAPQEAPLLPELSPEALVQQTKWTQRRARNQGFWAGMMNYRKADSQFRENHKERRQQRKRKRLRCRRDIRKANRGAMMPIMINCYRAVLQTELEMLRRQKNFIADLPGPSQQYRNSAVFHIESLSNAISTTIRGIDGGVYEDKNKLKEAKKSLGTLYRNNKRIAMTQLHVSRSLAWLNHLSIRLDDVQNGSAPAGPVQEKIDQAIDCLSVQEEDLLALLSMNDNNALIEAFRQEQSDVKFCIESARDAYVLNTELEQTDAENE